ncbi:MAG: acyl-CoA thioesterase [Pseudonocardiaceae bacterium]|nr:acyl-CoA thioesterase [Pseudonocardiaceae bacterium]
MSPPASVEVQRRVEWSDTDAAGHQHYTGVVRWLEVAETVLHERLGIAQTTFGRLPKVRIEVDYTDRILFRETVTLSLRVVSAGRSSVRYDFEVRTDRGTAARGGCVCVFSDPAEGGSRPWPAEIREALVTAGPQRPELLTAGEQQDQCW